MSLRRGLVMVVTLLALGGWASAAPKKLPVKTLEMTADGIWKEIVTETGQGMVKASGGQIAKRVISKVPGRVPWGGILSIGAPLLYEAIKYAFDRAGTTGNHRLDKWFKNEGFPVPIDYGNDYKWDPGLTSCTGYDSGNLPFTAYISKRMISGVPYYIPMYVVKLSDGSNKLGYLMGSSGSDVSTTSLAEANSKVTSFCNNAPGNGGVEKLSDIIASEPGVKDLVARHLKDFISADPENPLVRDMFSAPLTENQWNLDLIDPTIVSVPGSRYGDGDYLQEGYESPPGNRRHPLDGGPLEPWPDSPQPVDIDRDGIPDWRDPDDNGDGVPDDQQTPNDQKSGPDDPGYGRRAGEKDTKTTVTDEPLPGGGRRRTVTTTTTSPGGDTTTTTTTTTTKTTTSYEPPGGPGEPGQIIKRTIITTETTTTRTINNETTTTTSTNTEREERREPAPAPKPGDKDGDGVLDEDDPNPDDPVPEKEEKKDPEEKAKDDKKERCEAAERVWDDINETCGDKKSKPDELVPDNCGDFSVPRLLQHTGSYLRDVVFPCESPEDMVEPVIDLLHNKFPFSVSAALSGWFQGAGGTAETVELPSQLGVIPLEWGWLTSLWGTIKTLVGVALWAWFGYWLIDRFTPRPQI